MNLFVANWKMNMIRSQARAYAEELASEIGDRVEGAELVLAPPFTALDVARDPRERWSIAAQNVSEHSAGAFTGEISSMMVADAGCRYVIVGHSERRSLFAEDGPMLARKVARCREASLVPIYCVGETEAERARGLTTATLAAQVETLADDPPNDPLVVAYEPVWAIGTGLAATPADAASAAAYLRGLLFTRSDFRILYGGSVNPGNAADLLVQGGVDGFLVGGASLNASTFAAIARAG
ncbi:MAG TPA: triose-phosphate isomerase [Thermoanaerobaculia bacterium]|jgi:triosephosphate isomerase|nr:triose-phosphate isomerase [Thermoanaerobaculia bacterium]